MKLEFVRENGVRRIYRSGDGRLTVEIAPTEYGRDKSSLMTQWVKRGWMPSFVERCLGVGTYLETDDGGVRDAFNPQVRVHPRGGEVAFDWMLADTPENERLILGEIERRYDAAGGSWMADREACGPLVAVRFPQSEGEPMFVSVSEEDRERVSCGMTEGEGVEGVLFNEPCFCAGLRRGARVRFETRGLRLPEAVPE